MDMEVVGLDPTEWAGNTPYFLCTSLRGEKKEAEIESETAQMPETATLQGKAPSRRLITP